VHLDVTVIVFVAFVVGVSPHALPARLRRPGEQILVDGSLQGDFRFPLRGILKLSSSLGL
jgi:hypothetical protein